MSKTFNAFINENMEKLDLYTTAITRAHGKSHPEAFEVRELFEAIQTKVKATDTNKPELNEEFSRLHHITDNYKIPDDVCETYAAVYNMLSEAEQAYLAE